MGIRNAHGAYVHGACIYMQEKQNIFLRIWAVDRQVQQDCGVPVHVLLAPGTSCLKHELKIMGGVRGKRGNGNYTTPVLI